MINKSLLYESRPNLNPLGIKNSHFTFNKQILETNGVSCPAFTLQFLFSGNIRITEQNHRSRYITLLNT